MAATMTAGELLASVTPWLWTLARRYARRYRLDPDDVFQAACLRVLTAARRFDPAKGKATTWATWQLRHAVSRLTDERGKNGRAGTPGREVLERHHAQAADEPEPAPYLAHLNAALNLLPSKQRAVLEQRHGLHDRPPKTMAEIGRQLGVTRQRVHQLEKQAVAGLFAGLMRLAHGSA